MRKTVVTITLCALFAIGALGMTKEEIETEILLCSCISSLVERLNCYDMLAETLGAESGAETGDPGEWRKSVSIDPMDDSKTVVLALDAESGQSSWGDPIRLVIRCAGGDLELYVKWGQYVVNQWGWQLVVWRLEYGEPESSLWDGSRDGTATFYKDSYLQHGGYQTVGVYRLIQLLMEGVRFVVRVTPPADNEITAIFDTTGLASLIDEVFATCGRE